MEIFTTIYNGMVQYFGYPWISWLILFVAFAFLIITLLEVDIFIGILVTLLPILVFSIYQVISLGNYGVAVAVVVLGLGLAVGLFRLFIK